MFNKDTFRLIKRTFKRFVTIMLMVFIGAGFMVGLMSSSPMLQESVDAYDDEYDLFDLQVYSSFGFCNEDVKALESVEGVNEVYASKFVDALGKTSEGSSYVTRVQEIDPSINGYKLIEGEMPDDPWEALILSGSELSSSAKIGDIIEVHLEDGDDIHDSLKYVRFKITGIVEAPQYLAKTMETSTYKNLALQAVLYVDPINFVADYYTTVFLTVDGAKEEMAYSNAYEDVVNNVKAKVEELAKTQQEYLKDDLIKDAEEEIADAEKTLDEEAKDAEKELAEGEKELHDAYQDLLDAEKQLEDGYKEYEDGLKQIEDGEKELEEGKEELAEGKRQLNQVVSEIRDATGMSPRQLLNEFEAARENVLSIKENLSVFDDIEKLYMSEYYATRRDTVIAEIRNIADRNMVYDSYDEAKTSIDKDSVSLEVIEKTFNEDLRIISTLEKNINDKLDSIITDLKELQEFTTIAEGLASVDFSEFGYDLDMSGMGISSSELSEMITMMEDLKASITTTDQTNIQACKDAIKVAKNQISETSEYIKTFNKTDKGSSEAQDPVVPPTPEEGTGEVTALQDDDEMTDEDQDQVSIKINIDVESLRTSLGTFYESKAAFNDAKVYVNAHENIANMPLKSAIDLIEQLFGERFDEQTLAMLKMMAEIVPENTTVGAFFNDPVTVLNSSIEPMLDEALTGIEAGIDGMQMLVDAQKQIAEAEEQIAEAEKQLAEAKKAAEEGYQELLDGEKEIEDGWAKYYDGVAELEDGRRELEDKVEEAKIDIAQAKQDIADLPDAEWTVLDRNENYSHALFSGTVDQMANIGYVFPLLFFLVAALVCLTTMTRLIDEERGQIGVFSALGFSNGKIVSKYLIYALLASVIGALLGIPVGMLIYPTIIYNTWNLMYYLPDMTMVMPIWIFILGIASFSLLMMLVTYIVARDTLKSKPAELLRPKAPKEGKKILLEKIPFIWKHLSFLSKINARNIFRYKSRFFMTVIGVAGCTSLLVLGFGIKDSIADIIDIQYGEVFTYDETITLTDEDHMEDILSDLDSDGVDIKVPFKEYATKVYIEDEPTITLEVFDKDDISEVVDLRERESGDKLHFDDGVIISEKFASTNNINVGDTITIESANGIRGDVKVVGICEIYFQHYMFMDSDLYERVFDENVNMDKIAIKDDDVSSIKEKYEDLEEVESVVDFSGVVDNFQTMIGALDFIILVIILAAGSLALVVLINLTEVNISERIREIATFKVLGFYDKEVNSYIFKELLILTIIGALCGLPLGKIEHTFVMRVIDMDMVMYGKDIAIASYCYGFIITLAFTIIVAFVVSHSLKKVKMVESLKSVE